MMCMVGLALMLFFGERPIDLCLAVESRLSKPGRTGTLLASGVYVVWGGRAIMLSTATYQEEQQRCVAWVEGREPPEVVDTLLRKKVVEGLDLSTSYFSVTVKGRVERARRFTRSPHPPYVGTGFGSNGTYEYRLIVDQWIKVTPMK